MDVYIIAQSDDEVKIGPDPIGLANRRGDLEVTLGRYASLWDLGVCGVRPLIRANPQAARLNLILNARDGVRAHRRRLRSEHPVLG